MQPQTTHSVDNSASDPFNQNQASGISLVSQGSTSFGQFTPTSFSNVQTSNDDEDCDSEE